MSSATSSFRSWAAPRSCGTRGPPGARRAGRPSRRGARRPDEAPASLSAPGRRSSVFLTLATLLVLAAIRFDALPLLRGPAPYPPEWQWEYRPGGAGDG